MSNVVNVIRPISIEEVYARRGLIISIGKRYGLNWQQCNELVQEVAIKCYSNPKVRFDPGKATLNTYLGRIVRNMAVDMWRKVKRVPDMMDEEVVEVCLDRYRYEAFDDSKIEGSREVWLQLGMEELARWYSSKLAYDAFIMVFRDEFPVQYAVEKLHLQEQYVRKAVRYGKKHLAVIVRKLELGIPL